MRACSAGSTAPCNLHHASHLNRASLSMCGRRGSPPGVAGGEAANRWVPNAAAHPPSRPWIVRRPIRGPASSRREWAPAAEELGLGSWWRPDPWKLGRAARIAAVQKQGSSFGGGADIVSFQSGSTTARSSRGSAHVCSWWLADQGTRGHSVELVASARRSWQRAVAWACLGSGRSLLPPPHGRVVARWEVVDGALGRKNSKSDLQVVLPALSRPRCGQSNLEANLALGRGVWSPPTTRAAMRALLKPR
jgi:hypothetical protein